MSPLPEVRSHPWHTTHHHTKNGFRSPWRNSEDEVPAFRAARWLLGRPFQSTPDEAPTPFHRIDPAALARPPGPDTRLRITWLGHATLLLQTAGLSLLTDPVFAERASPLPFAGPKREVPLPLPLDDLPSIDLVLLSHDHYDHLDLDAIALLVERDNPLILAPLGVTERLAAPRALALDWGRYVEHAGLRVHCVPTKHFSGRTPFDRDRTLWASWYLEPLADTDAPRIYWGGDTGYSPHFEEIRRRHGPPEVVMLPIGAYEPRWFMRRVHVNPPEAVQAYIDLGGDETGAPVLGYHWGTFRLTDEPLDEPPRAFRQAAAERGLDPERVHTLPVGGTLEL